VLLQGLMLLSALAEVVTLGASLPFIAVLASPDLMSRYRLAKEVDRLLGSPGPHAMIAVLTIAFAAAAVLGGAVRLLVIWAGTRFTFATGAELSLEVYRRTLYQPYQVHIRRSSSEVIAGITGKIGGTMLGVLLPGVTLISSAMLLAAIMVALIVIDPTAALIAMAGFGAIYAIVTWTTDRTLRRNSELIRSEHTQVVKALQEGLGGIRDVLLDGTQPFFCEAYRRAEEALRRAQSNNIFIGQSPRPLVESFGMILIAVLAYALTRRPGGISEALPVLVALALGAQRLLPALQQAYAGWASVVGSQGILADTVAFLEQPVPARSLSAEPEPLAFEHSIEFEGVRFRYVDDGPWVIDGLDLSIPRGTRLGIVGGTGGGKSTLLDILMGLIEPSEGAVRVDGRRLEESRIRAWQRTIAHVPQAIYLADATIAENIAFGIPRGSIDMERVKAAARMAQIAEFIESRRLGFDEIVGERGVRLSGGQRQRIGIARALYKRSSVLVFDEATSALDNVTEQSVMDAIERLDRNLTILIIAHRFSTVRRCDRIVQLESGRIAAQGTYEQLLESSQSFRQMALAATL
jgi:ATP-binding cassette, subfamily B, bacterial PglK